MSRYTSVKQTNKTSVNGGISVFGALGVLFVALKLIGIIDWPWIWVTIPFWGGLALIVATLLILGLAIGLISLFEVSVKKK